MSGHSKWSTIKRQKGAADAKRGQIFTKLAKILTVAAKKGGDPTMNPTLRVAIEQARAENMPKDNIERAIKRGTGELAGAAIEEMRFEVYAPGGVGILVDVVTDNPNRANAEIKATLNKNNGKLAAPGAVAFQFSQRGILTIPLAGQAVDHEALELAIIEAGADSYEDQGDALVVASDPKQLTAVKAHLESQTVRIEESKISWEPIQTVTVIDAGIAKQIVKLMGALEDLDDVTAVTANFDLPEEVMKSL